MTRHRMHRQWSRWQQGNVLTIVIITGFIFSIGILAMLLATLSQRQRIKEFDVDHLRAQYAAEAAVVWANEQLWANPAFCITNASPPAPFNTLNGFASGAITVTVTNCGAGNQHQVTASVNY